ncbi:PH domain-containing protein [Halobaculum sp. MBLA0143]|uniref:PH domain-containing protein n=1 Tax=Halobaculum sp. MBLA0143 TaxID=3079933 RepID=UPI0035266495
MRRLHSRSAAIDALQGGVQLGSAALFGAFFLANQADLLPFSVALLLAPLGFLLGAGYQVAYYYRFGYELTADELIVESGVIGRQRREIPLERIQNVDVSRPALKRALGLAVVAFETAGGSGTEASLDAVSPEEADRLQREVGPRARRRRERAEGGEQTAEDEPPVEEQVVYEISDHELRVLSAVSFRPGAFAVPFVGIPFGGDEATTRALRFVGIDLRAGVRELATLNPVTLATGAIGAVLAYLLAVWLVSVVLTYLQYYGFRLERAGDELRYERGLVGRYSGTIPLGKVQTVTVGENVLMRRLGYAALAVETAGYAPGSNGSGGSETTVPLGTRSHVLELAREVLAASDDTGRYEAGEGFDESTDSGPVVDPAFQRPADRAKRRYVRRYLIGLGVLALAAFGLAQVTALPAVAAATPFALAPVTPLAARLKWRNRGYHETEWSLVTREGFWRRHTRIVPAFRLQTVILTRTLFQRRWDLASVTADTASSASVIGSDATVHDVDPERAESIRVALLERLDGSLAERRHAARQRAVARATAGGSETGDDGGTEQSAEAADPSVRETDASTDRDPVREGPVADTDETEFEWADEPSPDGDARNGHHPDDGTD